MINAANPIYDAPKMILFVITSKSDNDRIAIITIKTIIIRVFIFSCLKIHDLPVCDRPDSDNYEKLSFPRVRKYFKKALFRNT